MVKHILAAFCYFVSMSVLHVAHADDAAPPTSYEDAATRTELTAGFKNLQEIGLAFHGYHDIFGRFPPAVSYGPDGTTPYSWRVELLPILRHYVHQIDPETDLSSRQNYDAAIAACGYDTSQTWDSPHNRKVLMSVPNAYRHPSDDPHSTEAGFYAITGKGTMFDGDSVSAYTDIKGWPSTTLMIAESRSKEPWTRPMDIGYSPTSVVPRLGGFSEDGFLTLSADGAVHFVHQTVSPADLRTFITRDKHPEDRFQIPGIPFQYR